MLSMPSMLCMLGMGETSIALREVTLTRLKAYRLGDLSYDDVINELMRHRPAARFIREQLRALREEERRVRRAPRKRPGPTRRR